MALEIFGGHRLLDPVQIVGREPGNAAAGLGRIERLVEIQHQLDVGTDQIAHRLTTRSSLSRSPAPPLILMPRKP